MNDQTNRGSRGGRQVPLDHLRPGGRNPSDSDGGRASAVGGTGRGPVARAEAAEPAEPTANGAGDADAVRGKATRSPAETATRPHLEGSEQSPA